MKELTKQIRLIFEEECVINGAQRKGGSAQRNPMHTSAVSFFFRCAEYVSGRSSVSYNNAKGQSFHLFADSSAPSALRLRPSSHASCEKLKPLRFKLIFSMTHVTQSTNPSTMCTNTLKTKNCNYLTTLGLPVFSRNPWLHSVSQHFCSAHTVR